MLFIFILLFVFILEEFDKFVFKLMWFIYVWMWFVFVFCDFMLVFFLIVVLFMMWIEIVLVEVICIYGKG